MVFDHISKHLELRQKHSAVCLIFDSLLGVQCGQTRSFMFDTNNTYPAVPQLASIIILSENYSRMLDLHTFGILKCPTLLALIIISL